MAPEVAGLLVAIMASRLTSDEAPVIPSFFFFWAFLRHVVGDGSPIAFHRAEAVFDAGPLGIGARPNARAYPSRRG